MGFPARIARVRRQRAERLAIASGLLVLIALGLLASGEVLFAALALLGALYYAGSAAYEFDRARIAMIGARSEARMQRRLDPLRNEDWMVGHNLPMPRPLGGDLDHFVIGPRPSPMFVLDTKTKRFSSRDLARLRQTAAIVSRTHTVLPILVSIAPVKTRYAEGVLICNERDVVPLMRRERDRYAHAARFRSRRQGSARLAQRPDGNRALPLGSPRRAG